MPLQRRSSGKTNLTAGVTGHTDNTGEYVWLVPVDIRGQTFQLELDTGSDTTWVWSNEMSNSATSGGGTRKHAMYDLNAALHASPSRLVQGESFKINYLGPDSATSGVVINDDVSIAGLETPMQFGAATSAGSAFSYSDGLIGLGWGSGNESQWRCSRHSVMGERLLIASQAGKTTYIPSACSRPVGCSYLYYPFQAGSSWG